MSPTSPYLVWLILRRYPTRMPLCGPTYEVREIGVKPSAYVLIVLSDWSMKVAPATNQRTESVILLESVNMSGVVII